MNKKFKQIAITIATFFFGFIVYFFGSGKFYEIQQKDVKFVQTNQNCNLHVSSCSVKIEDKIYTFEIDNKPLKSGKLLKYVVKTDNVDDEKLTLRIVGVNMNMGIIEYEMMKKMDNIYEAQGFLPSCIDKMIWKMSIISNTSNMGANFIVEIK